MSKIFDIQQIHLDLDIFVMPNQITYTDIASILLKQINKIRTDPKSLIPVLQQRLQKYEDEKYYPLTGLNFSVRTVEGAKGVKQLISFLQNQRQCLEVAWSYELHEAADKRCLSLSDDDENIINKLVEIGDLVSQYTDWKGHLVQLTFYGFIEPKEFICELLLEDGRDKKQNREQFFNRMSRFIGIGISTHYKYRFVIVLIMALQVIKKEQRHLLKRVQRANSDNFIDAEQNNCGYDCVIY